MNGKLVIRVGGGYMLIDEFLKNYAEQEGIKSDYYERVEQAEGKDSPSSKHIINILKINL